MTPINNYQIGHNYNQSLVIFNSLKTISSTMFILLFAIGSVTTAISIGMQTAYSQSPPVTPPICPSGSTYNTQTQTCEYKPTCPDGSDATGPTCPGAATTVPATCLAGYTGPSSTGTCTGPRQVIGGICPAPVGFTTIFSGPYINNQGECEIVAAGQTGSNYRNCFGDVHSKTCNTGTLFSCPTGFSINDINRGTCSGASTTKAACPDGSDATGPTCQVTGPDTQALCPIGGSVNPSSGQCEIQPTAPGQSKQGSPRGPPFDAPRQSPGRA